MGVRARNGSERLRTIWTPEMDRYFIDLMLEQVGKENRFDDHLFSKRAWKHMSSLFNAKFKFQYEKDVLKNRHKTLRNMYRAVKNLLAQPGFNWDEKRKMVTADNNVWEEYIKVHPDARSYRIKCIPNFSDLCTIYGHAVMEEKDLDDVSMSYGYECPGDKVPEGSSYSDENGTIRVTEPKDTSEGVDEDLDDIKVEDCILSTPQDAISDSCQSAIKETSTTYCTRTRTYWQPQMDRYFINLMLAHVQKGNWVDGVFSKQAWMEMISSFNEKFGFDYSVEILKNRYKTLRRQYTVIKNLLDLDGFVWDEARHMVTADDCVWQDYIKLHTDARQFMTRPVPYYKDLRVIYEASFNEKESSLFQDLEHQNVVGDTKGSKASKSCQSPSTSYSKENKVSDNQLQELTCKSQKKRQLENCSDSAYPKRSRDDEEGMASALREMTAVVSSLSTKKNDESSVSIENVIEAVQALPDMDEDLILDACDFLEDEKKAKMFLALDTKFRKKWLIRKLRTQV